MSSSKTHRGCNPLKLLPPELRLQLYSHLLTFTHPINITNGWQEPSLISAVTFSPFDLAAARAIYYSQNTFVYCISDNFSIDYAYQPLITRLLELDELMVRRLRRVTVICYSLVTFAAAAAMEGLRSKVERDLVAKGVILEPPVLEFIGRFGRGEIDDRWMVE